MAKELVIVVESIYADTIENVIMSLPRQVRTGALKFPIKDFTDTENDTNDPVRVRYTIILDNATSVWLIDYLSREIGVGTEKMPNSFIFSFNLTEVTKFSVYDSELEDMNGKLSVTELHGAVRSAAKLDSTFFGFLTVAGLIAAAGLVDDSPVAVIASMLVSVLLSPILATTLGLVIHDRKLMLLGAKGTIAGVILCIFIGFIFSFLVLGISIARGINFIIPNQMTSRGSPESLIYGSIVAAASGVGVSISLRAENVSSLVGIAISASLLPPLVNSGLLLGFAITPKYYNFSSGIILSMAGWSFLLTLLNICLIYIFGSITFYIEKSTSSEVQNMIETMRMNVNDCWSSNDIHFNTDHHSVATFKMFSNKNLDYFVDTNNSFGSLHMVNDRGNGISAANVNSYMKRLEFRLKSDMEKYTPTLGSVSDVKEMFREKCVEGGNGDENVEIMSN